MGKDWIEWHADYDDATSSLARRLQVVRREVRGLLARGPNRLVSVCAGRGEDVLPVLASSESFTAIETYLLENHPGLASQARDRAAALGLRNVTVLERDAGQLSSYADVGRTDVLMLCGVFGNISDDDIRLTIESVPQLMTTGGHLIWTRSRREPDVTPRIRRRLTDLRFEELRFVAPDDDLWSVGVNRFDGEIADLETGATMFRFNV